MPTADQTRIMDDRARPRMMELWWALRPLTSVIRFMNTGAHPDDEISDLLAALAFRDGLNLSYACSTRGEGGQNDIGTEAGADLGALRTREMERACDVLGMRMYWHSETPDDSITDFGFSKSGVETLGKWGLDRTLARFVEIVRRDRPDILCVTFLDVPGQHGHHRAITQAAHRVMAAAADPGFASNLPAWQVAKLYLPAWSGAGQAYDDDLPPPPATLTVPGHDRDPVSGWGWGRIGQQSRAYHRTQGMGRWVPAGMVRDWPLHLAESHVAGPDSSVTAGLPVTLGDLGLAVGHPLLAEAGDAALACVAAFPDCAAVATHAARALSLVRAARETCPDEARDAVLHRLDAKETQLGHVLRLALGVEARARTGDVWLSPGGGTSLTVELDRGTAEDATAQPDLPHGWRMAGDRIAVDRDAAPTDAYRASYDPADSPAPALSLTLRMNGVAAHVRLPFERPPVVLPAHRAEITPGKAVVNLAHPDRHLSVAVTGVSPEGAGMALDLPPDWTSVRTETGFDLTLPDDLDPGLYTLPLALDGAAARTVRRIDHAHVDPTAMTRPAALDLRVLDVTVPDGRIGYIGGGNDRAGDWLAAIGADVTALSDADLESDRALAGFDSLVIGIFAMRFRPGLLAAMPRLRRWVEDGGTLVTLYHRPWDNWDPATVPPRRIEIGQPSLRWRVTDETAAVTHLADHPVLATPNAIGPEDWEGWVKERGLYFASDWDPAYQPLLEMADPDEAPHRGALLVGDIGKGRHVHCALILHHQMENLVPGAFRLMANLVARRE